MVLRNCTKIRWLLIGLILQIIPITLEANQQVARHRAAKDKNSTTEITSNSQDDATARSDEPYNNDQFGAHRSQPLGASSSALPVSRVEQAASIEQLESNPNGSLILEDLVNQFFEKNREAVQQASESQQINSLASSGDDSTWSSPKRTPVERSSGEPTDLPAEEAAPNQLFNPTLRNEMSQVGGEEQAASALAQELDDRLIQYDMVHQMNGLLLLPASTSGGQQQQPPELERHLSDYRMPTADEPEPQANNRSFASTLNNVTSTTTTGNFANQVPPTNSSVAADAKAEVAATQHLVQPPSEQSAAASNATMAGSGPRTFQARSMSPPSTQQAAPTQRAPQHTRPPYATHDQFSLPGGGKSSINLEPSTLAPRAGPSNSSELTAEQQQVAASRQQMLLAAHSASEADRQLQKLASSHLVELDPVPASGGSSGFEHDTRFYFSKLPNDNNFQSHATAPNRNLSSSIDTRGLGSGATPEMAHQPELMYSASESGQSMGNLNAKKQQQELQLLAEMANAVGNRRQQELAKNGQATSGGRYHPMQEFGQQQPAQTGGNEQQQQSQVSLPGALLLVERAAPPAHYAASLVNVTAPMVLPLSASEAMESALGGGQAAKNLLHQVSGLLRQPQISGPEATASSGKQQQPQRPLHSNQYYMPGYLAAAGNSEQQQAVYSPPANQFNPQQANKQQTLDYPSSSQLEAGNSSLQQQLSSSDKERMRLDGQAYALMGRRPVYQLHVAHQQPQHPALNLSTTNQHQASGFRSPPAHLAAAAASGSMGQQSAAAGLWAPTASGLQLPSSYLLSNSLLGQTMDLRQGAGQVPSSQQQSQVASGQSTTLATPTVAQLINSNNSGSGNGSSSSAGNPLQVLQQTRAPSQNMVVSGGPMSSLAGGGLTNNGSASIQHTNGFITTSSTSGSLSQQQPPPMIGSGPSIPSSVAAAAAAAAGSGSSTGLDRRVFNLTRVEHISAECSNDLIRTVIVFNGTFKGIIYSSGYVRDPSCLYINGTGKTRYDFSIRLNQCGTLGRQEVHQSGAGGPNDVKRRDQVMWNTLSIQYNQMIEQEWDEHFRVSCEYGSDFWKTVSFSPFNVETNTGAPVVFTVDPPQCQMEILRGHGMVGPRQEAVAGPVTVGDPLTLLIHMKSEKAGFDILVKNCIAHNGGHQKMQLIDSNGCVVNERFISPFRGTYNDNDLKHVTLYSYLKAFRFTGSPVLYLECEIHMCQSSCPPQMCYWKRLSKRSAANESSTEYLGLPAGDADDDQHDDHLETTTVRAQSGGQRRAARHLRLEEEEVGRVKGKRGTKKEPASSGHQISDKVSLFQALEVRQERPAEQADAYSLQSSSSGQELASVSAADRQEQVCYRRTEVVAFLFGLVSLLLVALSVTLGCCWRAASLRKRSGHQRAAAQRLAAASTSCSSANHSPQLSPQQLNGGSNNYHQRHVYSQQNSPMSSTGSSLSPSECHLSAHRKSTLINQVEPIFQQHTKRHKSDPLLLPDF